ELCCADIRSVHLAQESGVDGIELCIDLSHGGLTPSLGMIRTARSVFQGELAVLIRPRKGGFHYEPDELNVMLEDIRSLQGEGVDVVVTGALTREGHIDTDALQQLIQASAGLRVCFHKAIDHARVPVEQIPKLIALGVHRVLTSGGASTAWVGRENLKLWQEQFGDKIEIMAGGGIQPEHLLSLVEHTRIRRVHAALRIPVDPEKPSDPLGTPEMTDPQKLRSIMQGIGKSY
ncbi:MAG TPA: copper homeostasis protein CutC, partial [Saprospiraceae bacterium]|nr:copper homeostasis protein CutC [Saprospiraceae bacterium]